MKEYVPHGQEISDIYVMTDDVTDEQYEEVIAAGKAEGNLSRSNIVRKIKDLPTFSEAQAAKWERVAGVGVEVAAV